MTRVRSLERREAGLLAGFVQGWFRFALGSPLNAIKVYAHAPRTVLASALSNTIPASGRWSVGRRLIGMVGLRAAARNGCPF
jgi:hypothetical protein